MYRQVKVHIKTGMIILLFSVLVTLVFAVGLFWYGNEVRNSNMQTGGLYPVTSNDYHEIYDTGSLQMDVGRLMSGNRYYADLMSKNLKALIPVAFSFLTAFFFLSICLYNIIKRFQKKQTLKIVSQLKDITNESVISEEPILKQAYESLKLKFDTQLEDYKRLSSYLTHDQKNDIAILRTELEISENFNHMNTLDNITHSIDDILTLSEIENEDGLAVVDVAVICAEVIDSYRNITDKITFDYEDFDNTEIYAKSRWIYRAVFNLLDNAIKYGMEKPVHISVKAKNKSVIVSVEDHGIGIDDEKQESIFNERYRVNELNKDGYGLGLSLVSHVCDLCHGFVTLESEVNKGTTFYMSFPQI